MNDLTIHLSSHPDGWIIGRQQHPPYWQYWNEHAQDWSGAGTVYKPSKKKLFTVLSNRMNDVLAEEEKQREIVRGKIEMDRRNNEPDGKYYE
jgi:hypothetical protein